ncbi:MAG: phosphoglucosamine mutase [Pirellulaceae bacterium]|nr:phosphoglucosamine mutase [Pirellulaceae bacterium]
MLIISVSGLRGIVGDGLDPTVLSQYVQAVSANLPSGKIIVSRDGRHSGKMLSQIVCGTLQACGRETVYADVLSTPTHGVAIRAAQAAGGIQITASHNPAPYNGIKVFNDRGKVLSSEQGQEIKKTMENAKLPWAPHNGIGTPTEENPFLEEHLRSVLGLVETGPIIASKFRILLDSNAGAGGKLGKQLLETLGCQVKILGHEANGHFLHRPEPTEENLREVAQQAADGNYDLTFCQDPDADRLAVIDEKGNYIGEEYTLALCVEFILRTRKGAIVTNCSTSRMTVDLAQKYGVPCFQSAVGEANVVALMEEKQAVFGGEGSGGPIDPTIGYIRDSFVGMALILALVAQEQKPLSEIVATLPQYHIEKDSLTLSELGQLTRSLEKLEKHFSTASCNKTDGLRFDFDDSWLLVRASNTEPIVRAVAEAPDPNRARKLCQTALDFIRKG